MDTDKKKVVSYVKADDGDREVCVATLSCGHKLVLPIAFKPEGQFTCPTCKAKQ